ncbi:MAG: c-type cytochrome [Methylacidiphilales bacterium]|nr:c-type cytochrome [Candidatus Methylacidiphilales bacterium]
MNIYKLIVILFFPVLSAIADGDIVAGGKKAAVATCSSGACHGLSGVSIVPGTPHLAGLGEKYLIKQMKDFKKQPTLRASVMNGLILALKEEDFSDVAAYFNSMKRVAKPIVATDPRYELGRSIYMGGIPHIAVAACSGCHGPSGSGMPDSSYPALAGQDSTYVINQIKNFQTKQRANDTNGEMRSNVLRMTQTEIEAVAYYIQGLKSVTKEQLIGK